MHACMLSEDDQVLFLPIADNRRAQLNETEAVVSVALQLQAGSSGPLLTNE